MFAAFNGVSVEKLPIEFRYFPNASTRDAGNRVAEAAYRFVQPGMIDSFCNAVRRLATEISLVIAPPAFPFGCDVVAYGKAVGNAASLDLVPSYSAFTQITAKHKPCWSGLL